jgi:hypothetical protein
MKRSREHNNGSKDVEGWRKCDSDKKDVKELRRDQE